MYTLYLPLNNLSSSYDNVIKETFFLILLAYFNKYILNFQVVFYSPPNRKMGHIYPKLEYMYRNE